MRLKLTLIRSDGSSDDIVVTADRASTVGDVAHAIAERDPHGEGRPDGDRLTLRRRGASDGPGRGQWETLPATAGVSEEWLVSGLHVAVVRDDAPARAAPAVVLEAVSGPRRGSRWSVPPGVSVIGRDPGCDVALEDPYVSGRHARLEVAETIDVVDLGSANGVEVDGELVARASFAGSGVVTLGSTVLRISPASDHEPEGARSLRRPIDRTAFNRSPRLVPRHTPPSFTAPAPPGEPEPNPLPWLAVAAPILLGIALALVLARPIMLLFALMSPVVLVGNALVQRIRERRRRARSLERFGQRLSALRRDLDAASAAERAARLAEAPSTAEVAHAAAARTDLLWTRRPEHPGFLDVRLGTGELPSRTRIEAPDRGEPAPELQARLDELVAEHRSIGDVPIVENLRDAGSIGVAGPETLTAPVASALVAQLLGLHSPAELCLAAIADASWSSALDWIKWAPHASSPHSPIGARPHLADSAAGGRALVAALEALIAARLGGRPPRPRGPLPRADAAALRDAEPVPSDAGPRIPAVVVLVADGAPVDRARLVRLGELGPDAGVHLIWLGRDRARMPACCRTVVEAGGEADEAVVLVRRGERVAARELERLDETRASAFGRALAPLVDAGAAGGGETELPPLVAHPELIGHELHDRPEAVLARWLENDPPVAPTAAEPAAHRRAGRLQAIVGVSGPDAMVLDLRAHGPHALVGGTTGSGKSEFLQAWILGLAVEHAPDRVAFLLVDYKGGAAFADCVGLPHCVGLVTDLTPMLVRRVLTSLRAELRWREELLNRRSAKDLIELERRADPETPPALVIVIDEFAALAKDVPEFVDGVVDLAQRGRSLGIHLVMATQRPAGVIRDDLRANTSLRIGLRMADEADSRDVLGVPDAAHLDPAVPGRALVATGPGRSCVFQAAHSSGRTSPEAQNASATVARLGFGSEAEWTPPARDVGSSLVAPTDQRRLVTTISRAAATLGMPPPRRPWIDELPAVVDLAELLTGDDALIPLGVGDEPARQRRVPVHFRPDVEGHIAFYGAGGSGTTTALRSLAAATALTPRGGPVRVYGLDFAGGGLRLLERLPHVGSIIAGDDVDRVARLLRMLRRELEDRARRYAAASATSIVEYRRLAERPHEPRILLLIDGFAGFREEWAPVPGRGAHVGVIDDVLSAGRQLGMHVALGADRPAAVPGGASAAIQRRVVLRLADPLGYPALGAPRGLLADDCVPGRAIVDGLETQLGVLGARDPAGALEEFVGTHRAEIAPAPPIAVLPSLVPADGVPARVRGRPVLGMSDEAVDLCAADPCAADPCAVDPFGPDPLGPDPFGVHPIGFDPHGLVLLSGPPGSGRSSALAWLAESLRRLGDGRRLVRLGSERSALSANPAFALVAEDPDAAAELAAELSGVVSGRRDEPLAVFVEGIADFLHTPADGPIAELARRIRRSGHLMIAEHETAGWSGAWPLLAEFKNARRGLLLQPDPADGDLLLRTPLPRTARSAAVPPGRGLYVERGAATRVQIPHIPLNAAIHPHLTLAAERRPVAAK